MLVLVRHGESVWNASDRFAGWADVGLTATGRAQATGVGRWLGRAGVRPTVVHTSALTRAVDTADLILESCAGADLLRLHTTALNERHYGALQGMRRGQAEQEYGAARVARWRRGVEDRPPPDTDGRSESLADVRRRLWPYLEAELLPAFDAGQVVLVVSHGNTIRMLRQVLEGMTDEVAGALEVPTGRARVYLDVSGFLGGC